MKTNYDTACAACEQPLTACTCDEGPTLPSQQQDAQCPICGSDPYTARYRKALWDICLAKPKERKNIAMDALGL